jgi:hypothetical protein
MHASSPIFMALFIFGICLLFFAVLAKIQNQTNQTCSIQPWLFHLGFSVSYGSLFAKTWRLHKIFNNESLTAQKITNTELLLLLGAYLLFDVIILSSWMGISPLSIASVAQRKCVSDKGMIFTYIFIGTKGLVLLAGALLTYEVLTPASLSVLSHHGFMFMCVFVHSTCFLLLKTLTCVCQVRKVPSQFNESKFIGAAVYNIFLIGLIWVGVVYGIGSNLSIPSITTVEVILMILACLLTMSILLAPKFQMIIHDENFTPDGSRVSVFVAPKSESGESSLLSQKSSISSSGRRDALKSELDKIVAEFETVGNKLKKSEEDLRKHKERIEEIEQTLADKNAELVQNCFIGSHFCCHMIGTDDMVFGFGLFFPIVWPHICRNGLTKLIPPRNRPYSFLRLKIILCCYSQNSQNPCLNIQDNNEYIFILNNE